MLSCGCVCFEFVLLCLLSDFGFCHGWLNHLTVSFVVWTWLSVSFAARPLWYLVLLSLLCYAWWLCCLEWVLVGWLFGVFFSGLHWFTLFLRLFGLGLLGYFIAVGYTVCGFDLLLVIWCTLVLFHLHTVIFLIVYCCINARVVLLLVLG